MPKYHLPKLRELAAHGANIRLRELDAERALILRMFPGAAAHRAVIQPAEETPAPRPTHPRRKVSAAARKAISVRMRKYWKDRRRDTTRTNKR